MVKEVRDLIIEKKFKMTLWEKIDITYSLSWMNDDYPEIFNLTIRLKSGIDKFAKKLWKIIGEDTVVSLVEMEIEKTKEFKQIGKRIHALLDKCDKLDVDFQTVLKEAEKK